MIRDHFIPESATVETETLIYPILGDALYIVIRDDDNRYTMTEEAALRLATKILEALNETTP